MTTTDADTLRSLAAQWHAEASSAQLLLREHTERESAKIHTLRDSAWKLERVIDKLTKEGA